MKSILVPVAGSDNDEAVFQTALAAARPLSAHLDFFHVHVSVAEAARHTPHVDFATGPALRHALTELHAEASTRSALARRHVDEFCQRSGVVMVDEPSAFPAVSATWREEQGNSLERIMRQARHSDLIVMGRHTRPDGLPADLTELLLLGCGHPIIVAPARPPRSLTATVMICWKESAESARAVAAAMPLLTKADRVFLVSAPEAHDDTGGSAGEVARQLAWNGIRAEVRPLRADGRSTVELLSSAARDCGADLVVMGGYGYSRMRETIFGGCTEAFLHNADTAVFLMH